MMISPIHRFRDIERKPEYLQPDKCVPPPSHGSAGTMWFIRDGCGIACAVVTWLLIFYADFVVLLVMLLPSRDYIYSVINGIVFNLLAFLAVASHVRAMLTDPVSSSHIIVGVMWGHNILELVGQVQYWPNGRVLMDVIPLRKRKEVSVIQSPVFLFLILHYSALKLFCQKGALEKSCSSFMSVGLWPTGKWPLLCVLHNSCHWAFCCCSCQVALQTEQVLISAWPVLRNAL